MRVTTQNCEASDKVDYLPLNRVDMKKGKNRTSIYLALSLCLQSANTLCNFFH